MFSNIIDAIANWYMNTIFTAKPSNLTSFHFSVTAYLEDEVQSDFQKSSYFNNVCDLSRGMKHKSILPKK